MRIIYFLILSLFAFSAVHAQDKTPDEQTIVNKKYDEDGNLIAFDSTYVHTWSSDSSFQAPFGEHDFFAGNFEDLEKMMNEMMNDSMLIKRGLIPFGGMHNHQSFSSPDSSFTGMFSLHNDSAFFNHELMFPDMEELQKQFEEQFGQFGIFDEPQVEQSLTDEQLKELLELKEKHRKEMEELRKSWENDKQ